MRRSIPRLLAALAALVLATLPAAAQPRRVAVVVGNNAGMSDELDLRFAERDARKVARVLTDLGGFDPAEVHLVLGQRSDTLQGLLEGMAFEAPDDDTLDGGESTLLVYYSGHSDERNLHLSGTAMAVGDLRRALDDTGAKLSILVLDSCHSGAATRAKGASLGPAFEIEFLAEPEVEGQIVITSSSADEISQESDRIEGSFFTHHLVSGLYGSADSDADGLVTLEEAYRYAHFRTVEQTIESRGGVQHPSYRFALSGQGHVVLSNLSRATAWLEIAASSVGGEYFVLDGDRQLVLTEVLPGPNGTARVALPPGDYRVRKRERERFLVLDVAARAGSTVQVRDADMRSVPYTDESVKGLQVERPAQLHGPRLAASVRNGLTDGMTPAFVLRAGYQVGGKVPFVEPRLVLRMSTLHENGDRSAFTELDLGLAVGVHTPPDRRLRLALAVDGGLVYFTHRPLVATRGAPEGAFPLGLQGGLMGRLGVRPTRSLTLFVTGNLGAAVFSESDETVARLVIGGGGGLSLDFWR